MDFKYRVNEAPEKKSELVVLSIQHVFAMFGSTVLVPLLIGIDVSVALFTAGLGTLIYTQVTSKKVPVFIGSSFAYIGVLSILNQEMGAAGVAVGVLTVGISYILISFVISLLGTKWIDKILPPVVIGPIIIIIGLSLAPVAVENAGLMQGTDAYALGNVVIALTALLSATFALLAKNNTAKSVPIIIGIASGYIMAVVLTIITGVKYVDLSLIFANGLFHIPSFQVPFISYEPVMIISAVLMILPLVLVTISEHIGDHTVSSVMMDEDYLHDPGLAKTIRGDGLATIAAGLLGGPVNTTYAENTGVIMLTRVASIKVIRLAAVFAMCLAFMAPVVGFINSIPVAVMGGISILLFGMIAQNGIKILVNSQVDFSHPRNLVMMSVILVLGLGGATLAFTIGSMAFSFTGMALAIIVGVFFHLILPQKEVSYGLKHKHLSE